MLMTPEKIKKHFEKMKNDQDDYVVMVGDPWIKRKFINAILNGDYNSLEDVVSAAKSIKDMSHITDDAYSRMCTIKSK